VYRAPLIASGPGVVCIALFSYDIVQDSSYVLGFAYNCDGFGELGLLFGG
jgi:hypothetical protein